MKCRCGCGGEARWLATGFDFRGEFYINEPMCHSAATYCEESAAILDLSFSKFAAPEPPAQSRAEQP